MAADCKSGPFQLVCRRRFPVLLNRAGVPAFGLLSARSGSKRRSTLAKQTGVPSPIDSRSAEYASSDNELAEFQCLTSIA